MGYDEEGGSRRRRRAVELAMKGGNWPERSSTPGEDEGPWALPSTERRVNCGRRGRGSERGEKRGPEHEGARIDARSPAQAGATKGEGTHAAGYCRRRLALSAVTRKEARSAGGMEGAQGEATERTM